MPHEHVLLPQEQKVELSGRCLQRNFLGVQELHACLHDITGKIHGAVPQVLQEETGRHDREV